MKILIVSNFFVKEKLIILAKIFYKDGRDAFLVIGITRKDTFEEIKKYWLNQIKELAPNNIIKLF